MKITKYIMALATVATIMMACSTDVDEPQISSPSQFVAPVINNVGNVIINADNSKAENVVFTWNAADFGLPVQILYSVYLTKDGKTALMGTSFSTSFSISKGDFNGIVINGLGVPANESANVAAFVTAKLNGSDVYEAISSNQTNEFNVSTFAASLSWLYLCGEFSGGWDINNAPIFWETAAGTNIFSCMVDFTPQTDNPTDPNRSYFKVTVEQSWSGDNWGYNALKPSWDYPEQADSNLSLDMSEGKIFQITVNTSDKENKTIKKEAIGNTISLIGSFNDWAGDADFVYDYKESAWLTAPLDFVAGEEIKIRLNYDWGVNWGDSGVASDAIAGGFELKTNGDNIKVAEAGTYVVKMHANRTPFVLELIKQ